MQDRESIKPLFQRVMSDLGHKGWTLNWDGAGPYCWRDSKRIDIAPMNSLEECEQMLLHEIAHIDTAEPVGTQHTPRFWQHAEELVRKYLDSDLSEWQQELRAFDLRLDTS